jgi:hypothetical protein
VNFWSTALTPAVSGIVLCVCSTSCIADGTFGAEIRGTSNYVYRGYTRSDSHPSAQLNLDYGHSSGFYMGTWISYVDYWEMDKSHSDYESNVILAGGSYDGPSPLGWRANRASVEFQPYVGMSWKLSESLRLETQLSGYIYNGKILNRSYDYGEFYTRLRYADWLSFRVGVSPYAYGYEKTNFNADVEWSYPLTDIVEVSAGVGGESVTAVPGYAQIFWNLGVRWSISPHVSFDLRYYDRHPIQTVDGFYGLTPPLAPLGFPLVASIAIGF